MQIGVYPKNKIACRKPLIRRSLDHFATDRAYKTSHMSQMRSVLVNWKFDLFEPYIVQTAEGRI
jgi:hypothetical protein